eukprot:5378933-Prorocentrum_lima.AAC.1
MDGQTSADKAQSTGIRQGCPLSPYLFTMVMTALFHDIHKTDEVKTQRHRMTGLSADEVLYADDTICMSQSVTAMNSPVSYTHLTLPTICSV